MHRSIGVARPRSGVARNVVLVTPLGPVSGAHLGPAISLVFALRRELPPIEAALHTAAQLGGGVAGTLAAHLMFAQPLFQTSARNSEADEQSPRSREEQRCHKPRHFVSSCVSMIRLRLGQPPKSYRGSVERSPCLPPGRLTRPYRL